MKKVKKPKRKHLLRETHFDIDTITDPSFTIKTKTHVRYQIIGILKKSIFVEFTIHIKGVTEPDVNNHLRHHSETILTPTVYPVISPGSAPSSPCLQGQEPGDPSHVSVTTIT